MPFRMMETATRSAKPPSRLFRPPPPPAAEERPRRPSQEGLLPAAAPPLPPSAQPDSLSPAGWMSTLLLRGRAAPPSVGASSAGRSTRTRSASDGATRSLLMTEAEAPLPPQRMAQVNRDRVQESRRLLAAHLLVHSDSVMVCLAILFLAVLLTTAMFFVQGWIVLFHFGSKPCDQPLKWWLLCMMLVVPALQVSVSVVRSEGEPHGLRWQTLATPASLLLGAWLCARCETCQETDPELFQFAKLYLTFQSVAWLIVVTASCSLVSVILWMHRHGLLEPPLGLVAPARRGLIHSIEAVPFPGPSSTPDEVEVPSECSVCQEEFVLGAPTKRTPCGHYFHEKCLGHWLGHYARSCPLCRHDLEEAVELKGVP